MATYIFNQPGAEINTGTEDRDLFVASNNFFGAGDKALGQGGIDDFQYFADPSLTVDAVARVTPFGPGPTKTFAAFELRDVETFTVVNDSGATLIFDLSSSSGITDLVVSNSTSSVVFDQVRALADGVTLPNVRLSDLTNFATSNVAVGYQSTAGATSVNLVLDATQGNVVRIGTSDPANIGNPTAAGVETINVTALRGSSTINVLDSTSLTDLVIEDVVGSAFNVTIGALTSAAIQRVTNLSDGGATVSAAGAAQAVTFTGSSGNENFTGGAFNDTFNLGAGNNTAFTGGGVNTVTTLGGTDVAFAQGTADAISLGGGNDTVIDQGSVVTFTGGAGNDSYVGVGGTFNASAGAGFDSIDMGSTGDNFDVLFVDAATTTGMYAQVTGLEGIAIATAGTTTLTQSAALAGVTSFYLGSGSAGNDVLNVGTWTNDLTITALSSDAAATGAALSTEAGRRARFGVNTAGGGDDTVTTGSGTDRFLWRGDFALSSTDNLNAGTSGGGVGLVGDALYLNGDTLLTGAGANGFSNFEAILLESADSRFVGGNLSAYPGAVNDGNVYALTLTNANAPTSGALFINGTSLRDVAGAGTVAETVTIDASAVTAYQLDIATGAASDSIILGGVGALRAQVSTGAGNDLVQESAGNTANDLIDTGAGNDNVILVGGNNTVFDAGGNNVVTLGAGNDLVLTGTGNDFIFANNNLTGADTLADAGGYDAIYVNQAGMTDAMFAGVNPTDFADGYENLIVDGGNVYVLGANAERAGFVVVTSGTGSDTINLSNAAFNKAMTVDLSAGGNDTVILGSPTANAAPPAGPTPAGYFDFVGATTGFVTPATPAGSWNIPAGTTADRTGNANLVLAGAGTQTVTGGSGSDVLRVNGAEMDATDVFTGAGGYDAVQIDNTAGGVTAVVNLANVTGVELFQTLASGNRLVGVDADTNTITFTGGAVGTVTPLVLDNSAMNDVNDNTTYVINTLDADFGFTIYGAQAGTTVVDKQNTTINNNITFNGAAGVDVLRINGGDLGAGTFFDGAGGQDQIVQTGGTITDDDFIQVRNVEVLAGAAGVAVVSAVLGSAAAASGLQIIQGTTGNDNVLLDAAFGSNLVINANGGLDTFNAGAASGTMTFNEQIGSITAGDTFIGGRNGSDTFNIDATGGGTANLTNTSGIEVYNVTANSGDAVTLVLGAGGVNGLQTINILGTAGTTNVTTTIQGSAATANTTVNALNGNDAITLGSGNDIVNAGGGADSLYGNAGNDTLNGGAGTDELTGGTGNDTLSGGADNDDLRGQAGNDRLFGDAGNDVLYGGTGADFLDGGAGADVYLYNIVGGSTADSPFGASGAGRDTVRIGNGDTFDFGQAVTFRGTQANFGDAQSSITGGDGVVEAVFQADTNILWVDVNDDGALNNNDLQINIQFDDGLTTLTMANFPASTTTAAAFDASFAPAV